jgi:hypothetical protein
MIGKAFSGLPRDTSRQTTPDRTPIARSEQRQWKSRFRSTHCGCRHRTEPEPGGVIVRRAGSLLGSVATGSAAFTGYVSLTSSIVSTVSDRPGADTRRGWLDSQLVSRRER